MPDRRPVDQISTEELERILAIRKRKERALRLRRLAVQGRIAPVDPLASSAPQESGEVPTLAPQGTRYRSVELGEEQEPEQETKPRRGIAWSWVFNKILLMVEIGAL